MTLHEGIESGPLSLMSSPLFWLIQLVQRGGLFCGLVCCEKGGAKVLFGGLFILVG